MQASETERVLVAIEYVRTFVQKSVTCGTTGHALTSVLMLTGHTEPPA